LFVRKMLGWVGLLRKWVGLSWVQQISLSDAELCRLACVPNGREWVRDGTADEPQTGRLSSSLDMKLFRSSHGDDAFVTTDERCRQSPGSSIARSTSPVLERLRYVAVAGRTSPHLSVCLSVSEMCAGSSICTHSRPYPDTSYPYHTINPQL